MLAIATSIAGRANGSSVSVTCGSADMEREPREGSPGRPVRFEQEHARDQEQRLEGLHATDYGDRRAPDRSVEGHVRRSWSTHDLRSGRPGGRLRRALTRCPPRRGRAGRYDALSTLFPPETEPRPATARRERVVRGSP